MIKIIHNRVYVSKTYIIESGLNKGTLNNLLSKARLEKSDRLLNFKDPVTKMTWILLKSIPFNIRRKIGIPYNEYDAIDLISKAESIYSNKKYSRESIRYVRFILSRAFYDKSFWLKYVPYYNDYLFVESVRNNFAKTHSIFVEIVELKRCKYSMKLIFEIYQGIEDATFRTKNIRSFYNKIKKIKETSIEEALIHDFKRIGRGPYKLHPYIQKTIKKYYSNPLRYSIRQVTDKVNLELISREKPTISYSTVSKYINQPEVRNQCDILRLGKKYAEHNIFPHIYRNKPEFSAQIIEMDTTRINIPFIDDFNEIKYLNLCVALDVYSGKIVGYSFGVNEDAIMILECVKKCFTNIRIIPTVMVIDNHKAYTSNLYEIFKTRSESYGILHRHSKIGNPRDKGNVERWFYTFQTMFLNSLFGSLGNGIKGKKKDGRVNSELEKFFMRKENLRTKKELELELIYYIKKYNRYKGIQNEKKSPNEIFENGIIDGARKFNVEDIAKLFLERKHLTVKSSTIVLRSDNQRYIYVIYNLSLVTRLNGNRVLVLYDQNDFSKISIFDPRTQEYFGTIERFIPLSVELNQENDKKISKHYRKLKEMIFKSTDALLKDIEDGEDELEAIPLKTLEEINDEYEIKRKEQERAVLEFTVNSITKEIKFYNSIKNKKSMSGIMPIQANRKRNKKNNIQVIDK